jgi:hypothetical protein
MRDRASSVILAMRIVVVVDIRHRMHTAVQQDADLKGATIETMKFQ